MVFLHDDFRPILSFVVHDTRHVLADLDLSLVALQIFSNRVVVADSVTMEDFHSFGRHS